MTTTRKRMTRERAWRRTNSSSEERGSAAAAACPCEGEGKGNGGLDAWRGSIGERHRSPTV